MKELIYSAAHRIGAAAFSDGASLFYIMTSRRILMEQFIHNGEYQILLHQGNREFWSKTTALPLPARSVPVQADRPDF